MTEQLGGLPYWQLEFGKDGERVSVPSIATFKTELTNAQVTDLFLYSHGWNNSHDAARGMYECMFGEFARLADDPGLPAGMTIGGAGILWPSLQWADEPAPGTGSAARGGGGAASVGGGATATAPVVSDAAVVLELKSVFTSPAQQATLDQLAELLEKKPDSDAELKRFQQLMAGLADEAQSKAPLEEQGQRGLIDKDHQEVFERMATAAQLAGVSLDDEEGGAAGLGGAFGFLWQGAKQALRQFTYWQMKERAGVIGQRGLGKVMSELHQELPDLRFHLIGHSFGARLVSFSLAGLPQAAQSKASPVKSLTLLQGAFSHFAFAPSLPQDRKRAGALSGMAARVDGPLCVSFSEHDSAVGIFYPWGSIAAGQDASDASDPLFQWGAMGHDGAQEVQAPDGITYGPVGTQYPFAAGRFVNLGGNDLIKTGGPPSGAHGDICHPEVAWAILSAATYRRP